ncbi:MAG: DNA replication/repair protein RecF [Pseudomonadota bacterium]
MSFLKKLSLQNFRCYDNALLEGLPSGLIVLQGVNGAGKTNILEAVSLLTAGRGLRSAKATDIQRNQSQNPWVISAIVETEGGDIPLGTGLNPENNRRQIRINGVTAKSQAALSDYLAVLWLTPQMDRLFLEGSSGRRRFLDRMIFAFDSSHSGRVTRYENAMRQRSKLLQEDQQQESWLDSLEAQMAETALAITAARVDFLEKLNASFIDDANVTAYFPKASIALTGTLENDLHHKPALEVEESFKNTLKQVRPHDARVGGAKEGPHKTDLGVTYLTKEMPAAHCSTGEQKALLISIVLAHSQLMRVDTGMPPVLLLDEIAAHLDEARRAALFEQLQGLGGQVWMTGTDPVLFDSIAQKAQFFTIDSAQILPRKLAA